MLRLAGLRPVVMGAYEVSGLPWLLYADTEEEFLGIANNPDDYALSEDDRVCARAYIEGAHTWSVRARQLKSWLQTL